MAGVIVLANGCFDLLHVGHIRHLIEARAMGNRLVVGLTFDENVNKGPGRPVYDFQARWEMLSALSCVDLVIGTRSLVDAILGVRPHIIAKGPDWSETGLFPEDLKAALSVGAVIKFTKSRKLSTTATIGRILCSSA